jgi:hypothetical protein
MELCVEDELGKQDILNCFEIFREPGIKLTSF